MLELFLLAGGVASWWYGKRKEAEAAAAGGAPVPPALPESTAPAPSAPIARAAPTAATASNGSSRLLLGLGVAFFALKIVGAILRTRSGPAVPRVRVVIPPKRAKRRVMRRPGTRGKRQGVWESRGAGWRFYPYTRGR